jgi:hypothetical protein
MWCRGTQHSEVFNAPLTCRYSGLQMDRKHSLLKDEPKRGRCLSDSVQVTWFARECIRKSCDSQRDRWIYGLHRCTATAKLNVKLMALVHLLLSVHQTTFSEFQDNNCRLRFDIRWYRVKSLTSIKTLLDIWEINIVDQSWTTVKWDKMSSSSAKVLTQWSNSTDLTWLFTDVFKSLVFKEGVPRHSRWLKAGREQFKDVSSYQYQQ